MDKPRQLKEVRVYPSPLITFRGITPPDLRFLDTTHHVAELFSLLLPRGYILDGSSLVQITCGPKRDESDYWQALGSTNIAVEPFDFEAYKRLSAAERQELVLGLIEAKLQEVAIRFGSDPSVIHTTAAAVRAHGYAWDKEIGKLSRTLPGGKGRVRIVRRLSASGPETWYAIVLEHGMSNEIEHQMCEPGPLNRSQLFHKACVESGSYVILDNLGQESFRLAATGPNNSFKPKPLRGSA